MREKPNNPFDFIAPYTPELSGSSARQSSDPSSALGAFQDWSRKWQASSYYNYIIMHIINQKSSLFRRLSPEVAHDEPVRDEPRDEHDSRKGKGRRVRAGSRHSISRDERGDSPRDISEEVFVACPQPDVRWRRRGM